jgi:hypothetical protein
MEKPLNTLVGLAAVCAAIALASYYWNFSLSTVATISFGFLSVLLARFMYRTKLWSNPLGDERDFGRRPVFRDLLQGAACFVGAFVWAAMGAFTIKKAPALDTRLIAWGLLAAPIVAIIVAGSFFVGRGAFRAMFGTAKLQVHVIR